MIWPAWLWIGTPAKFCAWLGNRLMTWVGSFYLWKRQRRHKRFWMWLLAVNLVSMSGLVLLLYWWHVRRSAP